MPLPASFNMPNPKNWQQCQLNMTRNNVCPCDQIYHLLEIIKFISMQDCALVCNKQIIHNLNKDILLT